MQQETLWERDAVWRLDFCFLKSPGRVMAEKYSQAEQKGQQ